MKHKYRCNRCDGNIVELKQHEGLELQCLMCGRRYKVEDRYQEKTAA